MSALTIDAAATVRSFITGIPIDQNDAATVTGLRSPLGDQIVAAVYHQPITTPAQINTRIDVADMDRGDRDADLAIIIDPSAMPGIDHRDAEAWNVHMTLPTLLRILGADTTHEKE